MHFCKTYRLVKDFTHKSVRFCFLSFSSFSTFFLLSCRSTSLPGGKIFCHLLEMINFFQSAWKKQNNFTSQLHNNFTGTYQKYCFGSNLKLNIGRTVYNFMYFSETNTFIEKRCFTLGNKLYIIEQYMFYLVIIWDINFLLLFVGFLKFVFYNLVKPVHVEQGKIIFMK
jgi:hypothetical protein